MACNKFYVLTYLLTYLLTNLKITVQPFRCNGKNGKIQQFDLETKCQGHEICMILLKFDGVPCQLANVKNNALKYSRFRANAKTVRFQKFEVKIQGQGH